LVVICPDGVGVGVVKVFREFQPGHLRAACFMSLGTWLRARYLALSGSKVGNMNRVGKLDGPTTSADEPGDGCSRCEAGATVAFMVLAQADWMSVYNSGDGRPPKALWDAVHAEDWSAVRREWRQWTQPIYKAAGSWRAIAWTTLKTTVENLKDAGVSSPAPPFDASAPPSEDAIMREWLPWIRKAIATVKDTARSEEWARFVEALPVELQPLAVEHPERQASAAACGFEVDIFLRDLLDNDGEGDPDWTA
jgi:hypothetical protein